MNDFTIGKLTAKYVGLQPWGFKLNVHTCNVYHEYYTRHPVATFHGLTAVCFKQGVTWLPDDLVHLIWIRNRWQIECKIITDQESAQLEMPY